MMMAGQSTPHSLFVFDKKRTGRGRSKRKNRWAQNLHVRAGLLKYGSCSEYVLTKPGQSPTGSRRTTQLRGSCAAVARLAQARGG